MLNTNVSGMLIVAGGGGSGGGTATAISYDNTASSLVASNVQDAIDEVAGLSAGVASWGAITGTLSNQTDLNTALNSRLLASSNLSDVSNVAIARANLGLAIGVNVQAWSAILDGTTASYTTAEQSKLAGIEAGADVTNTANVTAAGALMESELTDVVGIKALDTSTLFSGDYNDLTNKPTIPTNNNQLTNGAGYITSYTVTQGDVIAHQAALTITESQISDLGAYETATQLNSRDAANRSRANHTGTQTASTISDFNTEVDARITASDKVSSNTTGVTGADAITNMMSLTQAEYDAIGTPDATTVYFIEE